MSDDESKPITWSTVKCGAIRMEDPTPRGFRIAQYPDGAQRVQGAYHWRQGLEGGVVWRDLPVVEVDEEGNEIQA